MLTKDDRLDIQEAFSKYVAARIKEGFTKRIETNNSDARKEAKKLLHSLQDRYDARDADSLGRMISGLADDFSKEIDDLRQKHFFNNKLRIMVDEVSVPKLLTTAQAADIACITERSIRNWVKRGELKFKDLNEGTGKKPNYRIFKDSLLKKLGLQ
jgi:hypothetical protein